MHRIPLNVRQTLCRLVRSVAVMSATQIALGVAALTLTSAAASAQPYSHGAAPLHVSSTSVAPGSKVTIAGSGFAAYSTISLYVHSSPVLLATTTADANGAISASVSLPASLPPGDHTLTATGPAPGGGTSTLTVAISVGGRGEKSGGMSGTVGAAAVSGVLLLALVGGLTILTVRRRHA